MRTLYIICFFLLTGGIVGCYEDKGNYTYTELLEIKVDSVKQFYPNYLSSIDTLYIEPKVGPADLEYDYVWSVYENNVQGFVPPVDTISRTCELSYPVTLKPGSYTLLFSVTEKKSGIFRIVRSNLTVGTALTIGWYVLKSQEGYSDLDVFGEEGKIENVIAVNNNGVKLKGDAVATTFSARYSAWDESSQNYINTSAVFAASGEGLVSLRLNDGTIIREDNDFFYEPTPIAPTTFYVTIRDVCLFNNKRAYIISGMSSNSGRFPVSKGGVYELSPYYVSYRMDNLVFDELSSSFKGLGANSNSIINLQDKGPVDTIPLPPVNNLESDLLYMGPGPNSSAWALLKKQQEEFYVMRNMNGNLSSPYKNPSLRCDTLDLDLKMLHAEKWASNRNNNIVYFVRGNIIYSCNLDANYQEKVQMELPVGERVSYMEQVKLNSSTKTFDHIVVATYDENNYKVYLFNVQAGNLQSNPEVLKGTGKVGDVVYVYNTTSSDMP